MRIPLDYYRILGLPIQASTEQLQQAYRDRILQLPRREYSEVAIAARKQLLEEAYAVLSVPEQRTRYDASYFSHTYERESQEDPAAAQTAARPEVPHAAFDSHTPSIEISDDLFVGALLILQELGEYELVLKLGRPYLSIGSVSMEIKQNSEPYQVRSDIVLTIALACLELGREQWQQGQYENAANSLEIGYELLLREKVFPSVQDEIRADLYKLRPYLILELLARPEENFAERRQGLKLLQNILQERGGIDGTGDDQSGLSIDEFLRFIQQLRSYLTAAEQQSLFESHQRPSAVATYLTVYALVAKGFAQRQPASIRRAKLLLMRLGKHQDLHLEQAICSLLLGQTEAASRALEFSQEHESLAFIRNHSQGDPDLLPGLCLYGEHWLQTEVFPHFRDLAQQQASLKTYFADEQVQAYLEALPIEAEATNEWNVLPSQSSTSAQTISVHQHSDSALVSRSGSTKLRQQRVQETTQGMHPVRGHGATTVTLSVTPDQGVAIVPAAERIATTVPNSNGSLVATTLAQVRSSVPRSRRRTRKQATRSLSVSKTNEQRIPKHGSRLTLAFRNVMQAKGKRLVLPVVAGVLAIGFLGILAYGWFRQAFVSTPSLEGEQPLVQLDQPPLPIPDPSSNLLSVNEPLTEETAKKVIQTWLSTKAAAFGSEHAVAQLQQILREPALSKWQQLAQKEKAVNQYRQYKHTVKVNSVQTTKATPDQAQVEATVNEVVQTYENGQLNQNSTSNENLRVRYDLVRKDYQWRIKDMTVLK